MKKLLALLLALIMVLSLAACGGNETEKDEDDNEASASKLDEKHAPFVGRWEQGYFTNSDDESFDEYYEIKIDAYGYRYIEFYSNGTGLCNRWGDDYCNGGTVFEWAIEYDDLYDQEVLRMYFAREADETDEEGDENGYDIYDPSCLTTQPEKAFILGEAGRIAGDPFIEYDEPFETVSVAFFKYYEPYAKVDSEDFVDNPDLGCEDAFESIRAYREALED